MCKIIFGTAHKISVGYYLCISLTKNLSKNKHYCSKKLLNFEKSYCLLFYIKAWKIKGFCD